MAETMRPMAQEALAALVAGGGFGAWLGLAVTAADGDGVALALGWRDELAGATGAADQAVVGALVDAAAAAAIAARVGARVPTSDIRVDHHRPASAGPMTARGRVVRLGGTFAVAEAEVRDAGGALVATGRGTYFTGAVRKR